MDEPSRSKESERGEFDRLLLEAVDEGLMSLGESVRQVIYYHLEKNNSLRRDAIPGKLEDFSSGLERIFGAGGKVIQKIIVNLLYSRLGLEFVEKADYKFADYVNEAKRHKETP